MSRRHPRTRHDARPAAAAGGAVVAETDADSDLDSARWLGERLRRVALAAAAALIVSRAFWPGEPDYRVDAGTGMAWVLALLVLAGLAIAAPLVSGTFRFRWSWVDLAVAALVALVAVSSFHALDLRPAYNVAWEWVGIGVAYLLVRNLPRTRAESVALAGALAATAVSVAFYGLYQIAVELPQAQQAFLANPARALALVGIQPGTPEESLYRSRLLGSNEPFATFALANSLAGFLVGPLVVMLAALWNNLTRPQAEGRGSRAAAVVLGLVPTLAVLVCLELTKSRSAWVGLAVGVAVLAWREQRRVPLRWLILAGAGALVVVAGLVTAGLATGRLDRQVFTQSTMSLRYRWEYWVGTWRAVNDNPAAFWTGYGPGNFSAPYVLHKLPQASEDVRDPHDFVLEVWAAGGLRAVLALAAAVLLTLWLLLGPGTNRDDVAPEEEPVLLTRPAPSQARRNQTPDPDAPPAGAGWLVIGAGVGGWLLAWPLGTLNPFEGDLFFRWLILGGAWALAVLSGRLMWTRVPLAPATLGAGALAILVNLIAAGGISIPAVALMLWSLVALGLNLNPHERPAVVPGQEITSFRGLAAHLWNTLREPGSGRVRSWGGREVAFLVAAAWAALLGTFCGTEIPHFRLEAALAEADEALEARPPKFDRAIAALERAATADRFSARPWVRQAAVVYEEWSSRGARPDDLRWKEVPILMYKATDAPRAPNAWSRHRERARMTSLLLKQIGNALNPRELWRYKGNIVEASRTAARLYPTNASLHAWLAEASADIGMPGDASAEGHEALRLDDLTPHADRKLAPSVRQWLEGKLPSWDKAVEEASTIALPKLKGKANTPAGK